jgi:endoglucanase Acf2
MKRNLFIFCLLVYSSSAFSHGTKENFDYSIIFGGCFEQDILSLKINNTTIFDHYKVDNKSAIKKGNLSLTQANSKINVFYNGRQIIKRKVNFNYYLNISLTINQQVNKYVIDLRKGKIILVDFCSKQDNVSAKKLAVEQLQEEVIFM